MFKILIVEDDVAIATMCSDYLTELQYAVEVTNSGLDGRELLRISEYDLIILDWTLPDLTGLEICRQYRAAGGNSPIIFLTGKSAIPDKELAFDVGTDDYLTKPFQIKELAARIKALLRRPKTFFQEILKVRDIELDPGQHVVTKAEVPIKLYPKDFALLQFLMRHPNKMFSADELLNHVWRSDSSASVDTVRQSLMRLRQKLDTPNTPSLIRNVHGVGYKLEE